MYKLLTSRGTGFALGLGVLVIAIYLFTVISGLSGSGYSVSDDLNAIMKSNPDANFGFFDLGLKLVLGLIIAAVFFAAVGALMGLIKAPKASIKGIIGLLGVLVLFFILYSMSDSETSGRISELIQKWNVSETTSKMISGGLWTTIVLAGAAFVIMVLSEIWNLFK